MRHPRDMGPSEVESLLTHLVTERKVPASTHNRALSALFCFSSRKYSLLNCHGIDRPTQDRRIAGVLIKVLGHGIARTNGRRKCKRIIC